MRETRKRTEEEMIINFTKSVGMMRCGVGDSSTLHRSTIRRFVEVRLWLDSSTVSGKLNTVAATAAAAVDGGSEGGNLNYLVMDQFSRLSQLPLKNGKLTYTELRQVSLRGWRRERRRSDNAQFVHARNIGGPFLQRREC